MNDSSQRGDRPLAFFPVVGDLQPQRVELLRVLGHGRAAEARLVHADYADGPSQSCVEKVFAPGKLTRLIYRLTYQAPFAYQDNAAAIQATFYRRRVAAAIVQAFVPEASVARPLYVRWDADAQGMVLASEYIRGRGIVPAAADPFWLRRRLPPSLRARFPRLLGGGGQIPPQPPAEIDQLLDLMRRLETLLVQCGLTGSGWQVCPRAIVSTANLLRTMSTPATSTPATPIQGDDRYVVVDLESGIPSVLVPSYLLAAARMRAFPLFDDLDADRLRGWTSENRHRLQAALPPETFDQLIGDIERLIACDRDWKASEPAIGRRPGRWFTADFWQRYRQRLLASWQRREIVDDQHLAQLQQRKNLFTSPIFVAGLLPGRIGRFAQRWLGHQQFRQQVRAWLRDPQVRRQRRNRYVAQQSARWLEAGRLAAARQTAPPRGLAFAGHWLLARTTPAGLHRWLTDRPYRQQRFTRLMLFAISGRFQRDVGRLYIHGRIHTWQQEQRMSQLEAAQLCRQAQHPSVEDYVRGFGMHLGLKLLSPLLASLKVGGAAASLASGNPIFFLLSLTVGPALRTAITAYRKLATGLPWSEYRQALLVGVLPTVGTIAFGVQIGNRFPQLSAFLMRDFAARVGRWLPIYGGKDSRTELACIASTNLISEAVDAWSRLTAWNEPAAATTASDQPSQPAAVVPSGEQIDGAHEHAGSQQRQPMITPPRPGRWDRLARRELLLLARQWQLDPQQVLSPVTAPGQPPAIAASAAQQPETAAAAPRRAA